MAESAGGERDPKLRLETRRTRPAGAGLAHPAALAGCLWLFVGGLWGVVAIYAFAAEPVFGLLYAIPSVLLAAIGIGLITRRGGVGLVMSSLILGTVVGTFGALNAILAVSPDTAGSVVIAAYGGVIATSSALALWQTPADLPA
jgi:hypothetical protein